MVRFGTLGLGALFMLYIALLPTHNDAFRAPRLWRSAYTATAHTTFSASSIAEYDAEYDAFSRSVNRQAYVSAGVDAAVTEELLRDPRLAHVDVGKRLAELRETAGLTSVCIKEISERYPSIFVEMMHKPVKSVKSVVMRTMKCTEVEYNKTIDKLRKFTNNRPQDMVFSRTNFMFVLGLLKQKLHLTQSEVSKAFLEYPVIYIMRWQYVAERIHFLQQMGFDQTQLKSIYENYARALFYAEGRYRGFFLCLSHYLGVSMCLCVYMSMCLCVDIYI
jgi:hypothetical protein